MVGGNPGVQRELIDEPLRFSGSGHRAEQVRHVRKDKVVIFLISGVPEDDAADTAVIDEDGSAAVLGGKGEVRTLGRRGRKKRVVGVVLWGGVYGRHKKAPAFKAEAWDEWMLVRLLF